MKHPEKWRETVDPFSLPYRNFSLTQVIGYPHAGNDVFQARGQMVQIYSHFFRFTGDEPAYQDHLRKFFEKVCR